MELYLQFVSAAKAKDLDTLLRIIREHPALHDHEGDDGSLLDVIHYNCPEHIEAVFQAALSPDCEAENQGTGTMERTFPRVLEFVFIWDLSADSPISIRSSRT